MLRCRQRVARWRAAARAPGGGKERRWQGRRWARVVAVRVVAVMGEAAREAVAHHGLDHVRMAVAVAAEAASRARAAVRVRPPAGTLTRGHVAEHGPPVMRDTAEAQRGNGALDLGRVGGGGCVEHA